MSSEQCHVIAVLTPKPDKVERVMELLTNMANSVKEKEINTCSRYSVLKQIGDTSEPQICVSETYASEKDADEHMTTEHFQTLMKTAGGEEVLSKPPTIIKCQPFAGFLSR